MLRAALFSIFFVFAGSGSIMAYSINGKYARLISCDWGWSSVRGESGYTGIYEVYGELWSVYFGPNYCPA